MRQGLHHEQLRYVLSAVTAFATRRHVQWGIMPQLSAGHIAARGDRGCRQGGITGSRPDVECWYNEEVFDPTRHEDPEAQSNRQT